MLARKTRYAPHVVIMFVSHHDAIEITRCKIEPPQTPGGIGKAKAAIQQQACVTCLNEWDIYLSSTILVKQSIKTLVGIAPERLLSLLTKQQPRFLWRVSLKVSGTIAVEWLADATGMARAMPFCETIWHDDRLRVAFKGILTNLQTRHLAAQTLTEAFAKFLVRTSEDP